MIALWLTFHIFAQPTLDAKQQYYDLSAYTDLTNCTILPHISLPTQNMTNSSDRGYQRISFSFSIYFSMNGESQNQNFRPQSLFFIACSDPVDYQWLAWDISKWLKTAF